MTDCPLKRAVRTCFYWVNFMKQKFSPAHDHHTHISFYSALDCAADLSFCKTFEEAAARITAAYKNETIVFAKGWKNNLYNIDKQDLEKLPPVAICNISLHCFRINSSARNIIAQKYPQIIANIDNQTWVEHNLNSIFALFTDYSDTSSIPKFIEKLESLGIYEAEDMAVSSEKSALFLAKKYGKRITLWAELEMFKKLGTAKKYIHGIKLFADGALGSKTAALSATCDAGSPACLLYSYEEMQKIMEEAAKLSPNLAIHAIGDAAIEQVIACAKNIFGYNSNIKLRIEHAQMITKAQAIQAKKLGIILSMQPNFSFDSAVYEDRLPAHYLKANNPFRMLIDEAGFEVGKDLLFGSDGMPHGIIEAAKSAFEPPLPSQKLTQKELTSGYKCK